MLASMRTCTSYGGVTALEYLCHLRGATPSVLLKAPLTHCNWSPRPPLVLEPQYRVFELTIQAFAYIGVRLAYIHVFDENSPKTL